MPFLWYMPSTIIHTSCCSTGSQRPHRRCARASKFTPHELNSSSAHAQTNRNVHRSSRTPVWTVPMKYTCSKLCNPVRGVCSQWAFCHFCCQKITRKINVFFTITSETKVKQTAPYRDDEIGQVFAAHCKHSLSYRRASPIVRLPLSYLVWRV